METACTILSKAIFSSGLYVTSFTAPALERTPLRVVCHISCDKKQFWSREPVAEADIALVCDPAANTADVAKTVKDSGILICNASEKPKLTTKRNIQLHYVESADGCGPLLGACAKFFNRITLRNVKTAAAELSREKDMSAAIEAGYKNAR
ncbi:MAG: 2-oxoacid:acceptor oxidoreductase family protein [Candidatus Aenigmarchaeota archaeon]|nr:2-oxoacid:acceptor oxidoreductase family protein [Candidatus Aenigmarchaeota archaeon]